MKTQGVVKWYDVFQGYGFITVEELGDVLVRFTEITHEGLKILNNGDKVELEIVDRRAKNVRKIA